MCAMRSAGSLPDVQYSVTVNGKVTHKLVADKAGAIRFTVKQSPGSELAITVAPLQQ